MRIVHDGGDLAMIHLKAGRKMGHALDHSRGFCVKSMAIEALLAWERPKKLWTRMPYKLDGATTSKETEWANGA